MSRIAVVGMACRYPDAASPRELWENALAGRRAFRRLPNVRLNLDDYWDPDPAAPDRIYSRQAAVLVGYEFDRIVYKIAGSTYRSTDLTHWLALDVAASALADAGFPMGEGLPRERTAALIGNSLTGEFSRANQLRLRWPYVRRTLAAALQRQGWDDSYVTAFLADYEVAFKEPFAPVDEDSLAGGLSNTIAGRVCNHFDLGGGGYTVDGACSSSLLSVATACRALEDGDIDVAIAGGVDLSIDPFETIGFAKTKALASGEMRVYDRDSNGFWPGEGCGMIVLMREAEARSAGHRIYASVAGWGISSDGKGGITRPEVSGYRLALARAYQRSGIGIETVPLFEGHGTGTKVGDATELTALSQALRQSGAAQPAAIGSVKALIGHTKAAAGVAGLIKAVMALHHEILPPTVGCREPHELLTATDATLRALPAAEPWPESMPVRAGVTAMGFGGINTHVVLDKASPRSSGRVDHRSRTVAASAQDAELLLIDAVSSTRLMERLDELIAFVPQLSYAELGDLAVTLHSQVRDAPYRAAVVVASPEDAVRCLEQARDLAAGHAAATSSRVMVGRVNGPARIGFLFPGQGSGQSVRGGFLRRRFSDAARAFDRAGLAPTDDLAATAVAHRRIVAGEIAGLRVLEAVGVRAIMAVGHSLGELVALHWAGALDEDSVRTLSQRRGEAMAHHGGPGAMAGIAAGPETVADLISGSPVVVAGHNGPAQTVVAGPTPAVDAVCDLARAAGLAALRLPVPHAFHSPLMTAARDAFSDELTRWTFGPLDRTVVSTVTGEPLPADADVAGLLRSQLTAPVLFSTALERIAKEVDLLVEVGPGRVLSGLVRAGTDTTCVALDTDDESCVSLLTVVGATFVAGVAGAGGPLFHDRYHRRIEVGAPLRFLENPCERAPVDELGHGAAERSAVPVVATPLAAEPLVSTAGLAEVEVPATPNMSTLDVLRRLAAQRAELPADSVLPDSRLLDDLHLSSITVGQITNQVAQALGLPATAAPTNFATASLRELADALDQLAETQAVGPATAAASVAVAGASAWARPWRVDLDEAPCPARSAADEGGVWQLSAGSGLLGEAVRSALEDGGVGSGIVVCLPEAPAATDLEAALAAAQLAAGAPAGFRFVLVQHGHGAAGLAKTLRQEAPHLRVTVVQAPATATIDAVAGWVVAEVAATSGFVEAVYGDDGVRRVPVLRVLPTAEAELPLGPGDVLLVTGGGRGITAECALALARATGAGVGVVGRSSPEQVPELAENLRRIADAELKVHYVQADVTEPVQVRRAIAELTEVLGPVTAVLHGAGINEPSALTNLGPADLRRTFAPKVDGLQAVLDCLDGVHLRLLLTLGSIIGRAGLRGEAHYAMANEWLAAMTEQYGREHPTCRVMCLEWSVWSGVGMGERLSVVESLAREGITPITPDQGVAVLLALVAQRSAPPVVVITGRAEGLDTIRFDRPELPLLRFVQRPLVYYPGVELVTEVELDAASDHYLADHLLDGNMLFPAVFGLEAMAQVGAAVTGRSDLPTVEEAEFLRPIVVSAQAATVVRIATVVTAADTVLVALRSAETGFVVDHFRATLRYGAAADGGELLAPLDPGLPPVALDPATDLYGDTMFQGARFHRLLRYHTAGARAVDAELAVQDAVWFAPYLPDRLLLGDPGARDALMHGLQVCVPGVTLLPSAVRRIRLARAPLVAGEVVRYVARERFRDGDKFLYDIVVRAASGELIESWEGLRLRAVRRHAERGAWPAPLLGPYLQRAVEDILQVEVVVALEPDNPAGGSGDEVRPTRASVRQRRDRTARAVARALGARVELRYRPDGRPEAVGEHHITAAHGAGVTLCVVGRSIVGCDIEIVSARPDATWRGLLGPHAELARLVSVLTNEPADNSATRVWAAVESLRKAGRPIGAPLVVHSADPGQATSAVGDRPGWVVFSSGRQRIITFVTALRGVSAPVAIGILAEGEA